MKVAIYARFGNKVEQELTEKEQREAMQRIAEKEGHTRPKMAWLLVRSSVPLDEEIIEERFNKLKSYAAEQGYVVVGQSFVEGRAKEVYQAVHALFIDSNQSGEADLLLVPDVRALGRDSSLIYRMRDELQEKGVQIKGADDFEKRMLYPQTEMEKSFVEGLEKYAKSPKQRSMKELFDKAVAEGATPMTLPKKKAWIFIRYSVPIADEMRERLSKDARIIAEEHGYDVKGETVFIGSLPQAIDELKGLMKMNPPLYGADAVVLTVEDKILRVYDQAKELYDEMKSKEIALLLRDRWEEVFDPTTLTGLCRKMAYEKSKRLAEFLEEPLEETQEELDEQEEPTMGGM